MAEKLSIEERIAIMLKKAESTTPEEAEMIMAQVEKLMLRHGIEQAAVDAAQSKADRTGEAIVVRTMFFSGVYSRGYVGMSNAIVNAVGELRCYYTANVYQYEPGKKPVKGDQISIVGYERDVNAVITLLMSLQLQSLTAVSAFMRNHPHAGYMTASEKFNEKRSFILGFGNGAAARIRETKKAVVEEMTVSAPGTGLVLVDRKKAVDAYYETNISGRLRTGRPTKVTNGYGAGSAAGRNANVGGTAVGGSRKAIR